ncbi:MAG: ABC transporter ATP-binding protein [Bulleidia sp.]
MEMIDIRDLSKSFGSIHAVNSLSFTVEQGRMFGFLGVNGAGKSTVLNMICGLLKPDHGSIRINGMDPVHNRDIISRMLGVVYQASALDAQLSVRENLKSRAALYNITGKAFEHRLELLADTMQFSDYLDRPLNRLSGGQKRKIDIARALFHQPKLLILDEPTTGLDPSTRASIWNIIMDIHENEDMTVVLTTHYMEEASICDHIVIIDHGEKIAEGSPLQLKNTYVSDHISLYGINEQQVRQLNVPYTAIHDGWELSVTDPEQATALICAHPELFTDYEITKGRMDDVFLAATGRQLPGGVHR